MPGRDHRKGLRGLTVRVAAASLLLASGYGAWAAQAPTAVTDTAPPPSAELESAREADPSEAPVDAAPPLVLPADLSLTNAGSKRDQRPPAPAPTMDVNAKALPARPPGFIDDFLANSISSSSNGSPPREMVLGMAQLGDLFSSGSQNSSIPDGYRLEIMGAMWMADGGYLEPGLSMAEGRGTTILGRTDTGGPTDYGSATNYTVDGDMVTIDKAMQFGDQPVVMTGLTVQSGQTATVQLPGGHIFQVTPTLVPVTGTNP